MHTHAADLAAHVCDCEEFLVNGRELNYCAERFDPASARWMYSGALTMKEP